MKTKLTQAERIARLLEKGRSITQPQASDMSIGRLAARINDLRREGWRIDTNIRRTKNGANIASYKLATP
ncbi:MAG: helix-turn-helix domain-containing protein [Alphaproteobacteria bacterium]|jgi:hypothetical protein